MTSKHKSGLALLLLLGLIFILIFNANLQLKAENRALSKAVFTVA